MQSSYIPPTCLLLLLLFEAYAAAAHHAGNLEAYVWCAGSSPRPGSAAEGFSGLLELLPSAVWLLQGYLGVVGRVHQQLVLPGQRHCCCGRP